MNTDDLHARPKAARHIPALALSMDEAAASLNVSKPSLYQLIERGLLRTFVLGKRRLTTPHALSDCIALLETSEAPLPSATPYNRRTTEAA